jgi:hypothetical protein
MMEFSEKVRKLRENEGLVCSLFQAQQHGVQMVWCTRRFASICVFLMLMADVLMCSVPEPCLSYRDVRARALEDSTVCTYPWKTALACAPIQKDRVIKVKSNRSVSNQSCFWLSDVKHRANTIGVVLISPDL